MSINFYLKEFYFLFKKSRTELSFLALIFFLSGLFFLSYLSVFSYFRYLRNNAYDAAFCKVFVEDDIPQEYLNFLKEYFKKDPDVKYVRFVDKEAALKEFKERFPRYEELLNLFEKSPLPMNFELKFKRNFLDREDLSGKLDYYSQFPYVETVQSNYDFVIKLNRILNVMFLSGLVLFVIFVIIFIPILVSISRTILMRERDLFELIELLGYSSRKVLLTSSFVAFIPAVTAFLLLSAIIIMTAGMLPFPSRVLFVIPFSILLIQFLVVIDSAQR